MIQKITTLGEYGPNRIFVTAVLGYNFKIQRYVPAPNGWEKSFANEEELVSFLADCTETNGCFRPTGDPNYWTNAVIDRQVAKSKTARTWTETSEPGIWGWSWGWSWEGTWDFWFHDVHGKTIDVRKFWPKVIAEVQRRLQSFKQTGGTVGNYGSRVRYPKNGRSRVKAYVRNFSESQKYYDDEGNLIYHWIPRGKLKANVELFMDWEYFLWAGRYSRGWKTHKRRRQWEHRLCEQEKHRKNRERKAVRRGGRLTGEGCDSE